MSSKQNLDNISLDNLDENVVESEISIQPISVEEFDSKMSPKPQEEVKASEVVKVKSQKVTPARTKLPSSLTKSKESVLIKDEDETNEFFIMRSAYTKVAEQLFPKENTATFILLGRFGANRAQHGMVYSEDIEKVLDYIDSQILSASN